MVGRVENCSIFPVNVNHETYKTARVKSNLGKSDVDITQEKFKKNKSHSNLRFVILEPLAFSFYIKFSELGHGFPLGAHTNILFWILQSGRKKNDRYIYIAMLGEHSLRNENR